MRALTYYVATSLDGFIADASGGWDGFLSEGDHLGHFFESFAWFDTVLMGRLTYEAGLNLGVTSPYPMLKQYVFSRTMVDAPDPAVICVRDDAIERVRRLKSEPGKGIWLCGGAVLARALWDADLVDALVLKLHPTLLGRGVPLFGGDGVVRHGLKLTRSERFESGVIRLHYSVPRDQASNPPVLDR